MRVLIAEDEPELLHQLEKSIQNAGYAVDLAKDGEEALFLGLEYAFDVAIIDLGLPKKNGLDVIADLRQKQRNFPILILTARDRWEDKVNGLEIGADDYLTKPFHTPELLARISALVRRSAGQSSPLLRFEKVTLDLNKQQVIANQVILDLTAYEYKLLEYLAIHAGDIISKTILTEHIYAQDFDRDSNVIEVFIKRLRQKFKQQNIEHPIKTYRGRGYAFVVNYSPLKGRA